jgi:general L-amino acid transport system substrate-binding protein
VLELGGATICVQKDSTSERHLQRFFARHRMPYTAVAADSFYAAREAYLGGRCDALTSDQSQLYALRSTLSDPVAHKILPEVISKEPLAPAVRTGDDAWRNVVEWTLYTLINAEELEIDSANVERIRDQASSPEVRYLLDLDGASSTALGLQPQWTLKLIRTLGNYGEIFERNLGKGSPLGMKRGANALWRDGGLLFAPPVR